MFTSCSMGIFFPLCLKWKLLVHFFFCRCSFFRFFCFLCLLVGFGLGFFFKCASTSSDSIYFTDVTVRWTATLNSEEKFVFCHKWQLKAINDR